MKRWLLIRKILAIIVIINIFILSLFGVFYFSSPISLEIIAFISIFTSILMCSLILLIYSTYKIKSFYPNYYRSYYRPKTLLQWAFAFIIFWTMTSTMALFLSMRLYNIALAIALVSVIVLGLGFCIFLYYMFIKKQ